MKIILAADHGGFALKDELKTYFEKRGFELEDLGTDNQDISCSYAQKGLELGKKISIDKDALGVGVCGTGLGMSFAVNRIKGVRGARLTSLDDAYFAKRHNNANVLVFGGRQITSEQAIAMIEKFLNTEFEAGRHVSRIEELDK